MCRYIWKRRTDGLHTINLEKTLEKLQLAARIIVTVQNPNDVMVISSRTYGQRGAIKFATYTGAKSMVGKWTPGTFTNPQNKIYEEPRLLIVDDPATCFLALKETSYVGIPVISFCGVHNNARFVDCCIPCNNRGRHSIGLMFWLLAREVLRMRGDISRTEEWNVSVDLFFYRDANKVAASQEKSKKQEQEAIQQSLHQGAPIRGALSARYGDNVAIDDHKDVSNIAYDQSLDQNAPIVGQDLDYDQPPQDDLADWGRQGYDAQQQGDYQSNQPYYGQQQQGDQSNFGYVQHQHW